MNRSWNFGAEKKIIPPRRRSFVLVRAPHTGRKISFLASSTNQFFARLANVYLDELGSIKGMKIDVKLFDL